MASTDWTTEIKPGSTVTYNDSEIEYSQTESHDGAGTPRYNQIGEVTDWTLEDK